MFSPKKWHQLLDHFPPPFGDLAVIGMPSSNSVTSLLCISTWKVLQLLCGQTKAVHPHRNPMTQTKRRKTSSNYIHVVFLTNQLPAQKKTFRFTCSKPKSKEADRERLKGTSGRRTGKVDAFLLAFTGWDRTSQGGTKREVKTRKKRRETKRMIDFFVTFGTTSYVPSWKDRAEIGLGQWLKSELVQLDDVGCVDA